MSRVKEEPPEEFVLVIQAGNDDSPAQDEDEEEEDIDPNCTQFNIKEEPGIDVSTQPLENQSSKLLRKQLKRRVRKASPEGIFECEKCDRTFATRRRLRYHRNIVHDAVQVKCEVCGKICKNKIALQDHRQSHMKVECSICHKMITKHEMPRHLQTHSAVKSFECDRCEYSATLKKYLRIHIETKHLLRNSVIHKGEKHRRKPVKRNTYAISAKGTFDCNKCGKSFPSFRNLRNHERHVHDLEQVKCEVCGKICRNRNLLGRHRKSHIKVECSICHKMITQHEMPVHLQTHSAVKPFECDLCKYSVTTRDQLRRHIERIHLVRSLLNDCMREGFTNFELLGELQRKYGSLALIEKKFKCDQCEKSYPIKGRLNEHKRKAHLGRLFQCLFCAMALKSKHGLTFHITKVHIKRSDSAAAPHSNFHLCSHCQLVFEFQSDLIRHLITCSKENPSRFECDLCGEIFRNKSTLRAHVMTHPSEKNFRCIKCGFEFASKKELARHSRSKMAHKCNDCKLQFSCKPLLHRHQLESHGKLLKCDKCSYQTANKYCLAKHRMIHDAPIACETCQKSFPPISLSRHQQHQRHGIFAKAPIAARAPRKRKSRRTKLID